MRRFITLFLLGALPFFAFAESHVDPAYTAAFNDIMMNMHRDMAAPPTGNADLDFAVGMIPHHQGAVDMAKLVLEYGTDPELREMAQAVIDTQTAEIAFLEAWIAANPGQ